MKRMFTFMLALALCVGIHAQNQGNATKNDGMRRTFSPDLYMKKMREFVTSEAKLTEAEATRFFPMLTEMLDKQRQLMDQQREMMGKAKKGTNLSEADYEKIITKVTNTDVEIRKIEQTYYKKFHTVLTWQKVYAVRIALNRFQMEALKYFHPGNFHPNRNNFKKDNDNKNWR